MSFSFHTKKEKGTNKKKKIRKFLFVYKCYVAKIEKFQNIHNKYFYGKFLIYPLYVMVCLKLVCSLDCVHIPEMLNGVRRVISLFFLWDNFRKCKNMLGMKFTSEKWIVKDITFGIEFIYYASMLYIRCVCKISRIIYVIWHMSLCVKS